MADYALLLDGTDDRITANSVAAGGFFGGASAIEGWAKLAGWTTNQCIFASGHGILINPYITIFLNGVTKRFEAQTADGTNVNKVVSLNIYNNDTDWHYFVITVNAAGHITHFWIDGIDQGNDATFALDLSDHTKFYIGQLPHTAANINPWNGTIDECRVSTRERTAFEVGLNWNGGTGVHFEADAATRALWRLDEGEGSDAFDVTGNHDGTITGSSWVAGYSFISRVMAAVWDFFTWG